jgi:hypothetical protein
MVGQPAMSILWAGLFWGLLFTQANDCVTRAGRVHVKVRPECRTVQNGIELAYNSLGYRDREFSRKSPGKIRILLLGPGLETEELPSSQLAAHLLEQELNKKLPDAPYEILNGSIDGRYSYSDLRHLVKNLKSLRPDLVLYYQTSRNIPFDLWEAKQFNVDDDEMIEPRPCHLKDFNIFVRFLALFSSDHTFLCEARHMISVNRDIRRNRGRYRGRMLYESYLEPVNQSFRSMTLFSYRLSSLKIPFVVLMAPESVSFSKETFRSLAWKDLALYFFTPEVKIDGSKILRYSSGTGYHLIAAPSTYAELYTPPFLMKDSRYVLNGEGQAKWAVLTASLLSSYLEKLRKSAGADVFSPFDHMNQTHDEPGE